MTYSDYIEKAQSELFGKCGVIFAFSNTQFEEKADLSIDYINFGAGLIAPKNQVKNVVSGLNKIWTEARQLRLSQNTPEEIIICELYNHECQITGNDEDAREALACYEFSDEQYQAAWNTFWNECIENDLF